MMVNCMAISLNAGEAVLSLSMTQSTGSGHLGIIQSFRSWNLKVKPNILISWGRTEQGYSISRIIDFLLTSTFHKKKQWGMGHAVDETARPIPHFQLQEILTDVSALCIFHSAVCSSQPSRTSSKTRQDTVPAPHGSRACTGCSVTP